MRSVCGCSARASSEHELNRLLGLQEELSDFIAAVRACAEKGPPPADGCTDREVDAPYDPDLDDGVMINSAALWPLLDPQWKKPKAWWKELANAKGKKDYDWAHLAARYFPERVDDKCQKDPSLGVAHGCFWRYHPDRAWRWELRLGLEIEPGFTIEEADSDDERLCYLDEQPGKALDALKDEVKRRKRKEKDAPLFEVALPIAGLWDLFGHELVDLEVELTRDKGFRRPVTFPEPGGGREDWLAMHPKAAARIAAAHREVEANQRSLF